MKALDTTRYTDKSEIINIIFSNKEVLNTSEDHLNLGLDLAKALSLGNLHKQHVLITFKNDKSEILKTIVTVWAVTEKYVILKGGVSLPIKSIVKVDFG